MYEMASAGQELTSVIPDDDDSCYRHVKDETVLRVLKRVFSKTAEEDYHASLLEVCHLIVLHVILKRFFPLLATKGRVFHKCSLPRRYCLWLWRTSIATYELESILSWCWPYIVWCHWKGEELLEWGSGGDRDTLQQSGQREAWYVTLSMHALAVLLSFVR